MGNPKKPRVSLRLEIGLHKLTPRLCCCRKHLSNSLNTKKLSWCLHRPFTSLGQSSSYQKMLYMLPKENHKHKASYQPDLQWHIVCKVWLPQWCHKCHGSNQPTSNLTSGPLREMEPISNTAWMAKNLKLGRPGYRGQPNAIVLLKEHSNKTTPSDILPYSYTHALLSHH